MRRYQRLVISVPRPATFLEKEPTDEQNGHEVSQRKAYPKRWHLEVAEFTGSVRPVRPGAADDPGAEANYEQDY
jgi:hypothetical protein